MNTIFEKKLTLAEADLMYKTIFDFRNRLISALCDEDIELDCLASPYGLGETKLVRLCDCQVVDIVGDYWSLDDLTIEDLIYIFESLNKGK
jgi:hypothetical protein